MDIPNLLHADRRQFENALVNLTNRRRRAKPEIQELLNALEAFDKDEALPHSEKSRRVQLLFAASRADRDDLVKVADYAARLGPTMRNALLTCLPSEIQQRVYQSALQTSKEPISPAAPESAAPTPRPTTENPPIVEAAEEIGVEFEDRRYEGAADHKVVLLLGAADKHEANITLLKAKGFEPVRAFSADERDKLLKSFVCGIVVDGSWWSLFPVEQHSEQLRLVVAHSTFAFVRVDLTGLSATVGAQFAQLVTEIRFRDASINECAWGDSARLTTTDLAALDQAASTLATRRQCRFHPSEIGEDEGTILLAAVKKRVKSRHPFNGLEIKRVDTSVVVGGQTGARVFVLKPDDRGAPFVAKIDSVERLKDEMERFSRFISPWETQLQPELHIHGDIGVILFGLVGDAGKGGAPAPTLEDRLKLLSGLERGATISNPPSLTDLTTAVHRTVQKLTELNSQPCNPKGMTNRCWLGIEPLHKMKDRNITYTVNGPYGTIDIIQLSERAMSKAARLNGKGTVHGDVHCRNILVRDDRDPFLIDYANSGPGHPCFDLIRFESALVFSNLRMTTDEAELEACFKQVFVDGKSFDAVSRVFPSICASAGSQVALEAAVCARTAALKMSTKYGGDEEDYLAVKFVIACQSLTMPEFQSGVVRAAIKALAPLIANF